MRCLFFTVRRSHFAVIALVSLLALTGCDPSLQSTPVSIFPTAMPPGTRLPTFDPGGGFGQPTVPPLPTTILINPMLPPTQFIPATVFIPPTALPPTTVPTRRPPTTIPTLDANWYPTANPGVQWRTLQYRNSAGANVGLLVVRIDPNRVQFKVHYVPNQVFSIQQWQQRLPAATMVINGNFFDTSNRPLGLLAVDNVIYGAANLRPRQRDDGLFQVRNGAASVRSLHLEPFNPAERFEQAVHGFPLLMARGLVAPINPDVAGTSDRRTVIAQDRYGRILVLMTQVTNTTLPDLARWLSVSGLEINMALNLDGGNSSSMYLATGGPFQFTAGLKSVPVVLAVYPR